ncbi:MAG TPA: hypothetical protein VFH14_03360 [Gemmatimonadaceae bacterium]|nr:hypothetical protein [Gemmatimonadaceae bacterium]
MPAMRFQACHIHTPHPANPAALSVRVAGPDGKAALTAAAAERPLRGLVP